MTRPLALVIDDEPDIRELLEITLSRMDLEVEAAADCAQARALLEQHAFDLCFTDMRLPDGNGIDLVKHISRNYSGLPVAVITAHGNTEAAVEALKSGAFDFVSKPVDLTALRAMVNTALKVNRPGEEGPAPSHDLLGTSREINAVRRQIEKLARSQAPIHISGESGVGKELAARMIHERGPRSDGPFVAVNCGAIPTELMESEFFGHKKGSFTGATADKHGLFEAATGGTIFLDEVADLPLHMQVKLLRVIQEKSVRPIGATREQSVDVRILSATHKNLLDLVHDGDFRQDLYYRINVIELHMPGLRERPADIAPLADHFLRQIARDWQMEPAGLSEDAIAALQDYSFPGNVRELHNILERAVTLCEDDLIRATDLQLPSEHELPAPGDYERGNLSLEEYMGNIERDAIVQALEETRYNKTAAAKKLGITFRALRYRLKKLNLE
ncbi:MAG: sigma-54 dependent transcriptional regulator [Xanthomonadales bacterium]|nr:sigma-54 dependent transcriptional regulator [Xanthomonadales bacterium]